MGLRKLIDRAKDIIKSGGEWISPVDLENVAMNHPEFEIATVVGISHPKWEEYTMLSIKNKVDLQVFHEQ